MPEVTLSVSRSWLRQPGTGVPRGHTVSHFQTFPSLPTGSSLCQNVPTGEAPAGLCQESGRAGAPHRAQLRGDRPAAQAARAGAAGCAQTSKQDTLESLMSPCPE